MSISSLSLSSRRRCNCKEYLWMLGLALGVWLRLCRSVSTGIWFFFSLSNAIKYGFVPVTGLCRYRGAVRREVFGMLTHHDHFSWVCRFLFPVLITFLFAVSTDGQWTQNIIPQVLNSNHGLPYVQSWPSSLPRVLILARFFCFSLRVVVGPSILVERLWDHPRQVISAAPL
jgi:hypothetical protein